MLVGYEGILAAQDHDHQCLQRLRFVSSYCFMVFSNHSWFMKQLIFTLWDKSHATSALLSPIQHHRRPDILLVGDFWCSCDTTKMQKRQLRAHLSEAYGDIRRALSTEMRAGGKKSVLVTIHSCSHMKFEHTYNTFRCKKQLRQSHSLHLGYFTVEGEIKVIIYPPHKR